MARINAPHNSAFNLRDLREGNWFWVHKVIIDTYAPILGHQATLVYIALARECDGKESIVQLSLRDISNRTSLGRVSVWRALGILSFASLVVQVEPATHRSAAIYALTNAPKVAAAMTEQAWADLAYFVEIQRDRTPTPTNPSVSVGNTSELWNSASKSCGNALENNHISTDAPGTPVFPQGNISVPARKHHLIKKVVPHKNKRKKPGKEDFEPLLPRSPEADHA